MAIDFWIMKYYLVTNDVVMELGIDLIRNLLPMKYEDIDKAPEERARGIGLL